MTLYEIFKKKKLVDGINLREFYRQFTSLGACEENLRYVIRTGHLCMLMRLADATGLDLHREDPRPYMTRHIKVILAKMEISC